MKKAQIVVVLIIGLLFSGRLEAQEVRNLVVEPNHSTIQFSVPIANGITRITGKFTDYAINFDLVDNNIAKSSINVKIKVNSINTGVPGRDEHLLTKDFFDATTYPEITFTSERIEMQEDQFLAHGVFTMHGVTKNMSIPLFLTGRDGDNTFGFKSRLTLKRSDFNLASDFTHTSMENFIGDEIGVEIDFWTKKKKTPKK